MFCIKYTFFSTYDRRLPIFETILLIEFQVACQLCALLLQKLEISPAFLFQKINSITYKFCTNSTNCYQRNCQYCLYNIFYNMYTVKRLWVILSIFNRNMFPEMLDCLRLLLLLPITRNQILRHSKQFKPLYRRDHGSIFSL